MTSTALPVDAPASGADPRRWLGLLVVVLAAFMDFLDASIVAVAVPSIQTDLDAGSSALQWVIAGYTLAFALLLITGGRLGDIFGRRGTFLFGVVGFTAASALCGASQSPEMLIAARVLQGAMGALMVPQVLAMIQVNFPKEEQSKAYAIYGTFGGLAFVAGPLLGGLLIEANVLDLGWRAIFLINVPVGVLAIGATLALLPESKAARASRLDLGGVALVSGALLMLVYPLVQGRELDWPAWTFALMAASLPTFALFVLYERRVERATGEPLINLRLFSRRSFAGGIMTTLLLVFGAAAFFLIYSITLQFGYGFSALHMALTMMPWPVAFIVGASVSTKLAPVHGRRLLAVGGMLLALGMLALVYTFEQIDGALHSWQLIPAMLAGGLGAGLAFPTVTALVLEGVPGEDAGAASGLVNTSFQLGGAIGVAVLGVVFFNVLGSHAETSARAAAPDTRSALIAHGVPAETADARVERFNACFDEQMNAKDPAAVPPGCEPAADGEAASASAVPATLTRAQVDAQRDNFKNSFQTTLWVEVAMFVLAAALCFLLPPRTSHALDELPDATAA